MDIKSIVQPFLQHKNWEDAKTLQLKTGQFVQGKVVESLNQQMAMIAIRGMKIIAKTEVPLAKGQEAWFMVLSEEGEIPKLKMLDSYYPSENRESAISELLKSIQLKDSPELRKVVSYLLEKNVPLSKENIQTIEDYIASNYKGMTTVLQATSGYSDEFGSRLESAVFQLAAQQLIIETGSAQSFTHLVLQFPNFAPLSDHPVYVQFHSKKKKSSLIDIDDVRVAFLFHFPALGEMIVQLQLYQKQMIIEIFNNHPQIYQIIKNIEGEFKEFAVKLGYQTSGIQVKAMKEIKAQKKFQPSINKYQGVDIRL